MDESADGKSFGPASGPALALGPAGSGRTELLAGKAAALVAAGTPAGRIMMLSQTVAGRVRLRERVADRLGGSFEEVWIETWPGVGERLLRDYALEAGIDPFFEVAGPADRLALLLDRLDELPLRRHEIRGNPAGLLAGLLERIDALKAEGIGPAELRDRARAAERGAAGRSEREVALRELEFAELFDRHDAVMLELGMFDENELVLELGRVLTRHPDLSTALARRFEWLLVDELEDAGRPQIACLPLLAPSGNVLAACDPDQGLRANRGYGEAAPLAFLEAFPGAERIELGPSRRSRGAVAAALETIAGLVPASYRERLPAALRREPSRAGLRADGGADAREPARRSRVRGAQRPLPQLRLGRLLRPPRGSRRDRLAASARRSGRLGRGRPGAHPAAGRAAVGRPRPLYDDRSPPQARHDLGGRSRAGEPAAPASVA